MRVRVDRDACQTAATCLMFRLQAAQALYELDEESIAVLVKENGDKTSDWVELSDLAGYDAAADDKMREILLDSAKACPFNAIIVEDDEGVMIWPEEL